MRGDVLAMRIIFACNHHFRRVIDIWMVCCTYLRICEELDGLLHIFEDM